MIKELPVSVTVPCYNKECTNIIQLRLDAGYYKNKCYDGECMRCGIRIVIQKFSPFLEFITVDETDSTPGSEKINRITKPKKDQWV
jgi:hypothetical protein